MSTANTKKPTPRHVVISLDEKRAGSTNLDHVQLGVEEFHENGFVILENAVSSDIVDKVRNQMLADSTTCLSWPDLKYNNGVEKTNFSMVPPLTEELFSEEIWANKHAAAIMEQIIGPRPTLSWASSNVNLPGSGNARQAVHSDAYADIPNFPFSIEMNIYLQDTNAENGSTELWPGTHACTELDHISTGRGWIKNSSFVVRAIDRPPIQPTIPKGTIILRDLRLWHAGMPNTSANPRIMIALVYFPSWYRPQMQVTLPASLRPKAQAWTQIDLLTNTDFSPNLPERGYLGLKFPINFTQDLQKGMVPYRHMMDTKQGRPIGCDIPVKRNNFWVKGEESQSKGDLDSDKADGEEPTPMWMKISGQLRRKAKLRVSVIDEKENGWYREA